MKVHIQKLTYRLHGEKGQDMIRVTNEREYRTGYEILRALTDTTGTLESYTIELKRSLRQYASKKAIYNVGLGFTCERRIIKDYGIDGYIELVSIPAVFNTLEDSTDGPGAETFFKDFIEKRAYPSPYDCTGQAFTNWYKIFKRRGQFWVYHSVAVDV